MWETTSGSALQGETSIQSAVREIREELGINIDESTGKFIGTTLRHYPHRPDILDVWLFESDVPIEQVKIQEDEVCDAMWASAEKIRQLYRENKFMANAFFEEILEQASM